MNIVDIDMKLLGIIKYSKKLISISLVVILTLFSISTLTTIVNAGSFTDAKLTISDSRASRDGVTYRFDLTPVDTVSVLKQIDIQFCKASAGACVAPDDMDTGTTLDSDTIAGGGDRTVTQYGGANTLRVSIQTPAAQEDPFQMTFTGVVNPSNQNASIYARITSYSDAGTTQVDEATVAAGILTSSSISISAEVGPTFTFTVEPNVAGNVNGEAITITDTLEDQIPFGVLEDGTSKVAAHDVTVITNANSGFLVTVKSVNDPTELLKDGTNNIDTFAGGDNAVPDTWDSPTATAKNENTGFFGYTTTDTTLAGSSSRFDSNKWAGPTTTAEEVMYNGAATIETGIKETIGWQAEVNEYQPPGSYTGTMILVATPTY